MFIFQFGESSFFQIPLILLTCGYSFFIHICILFAKFSILDLKFSQLMKRVVYPVFTIWMLIFSYILLVLITKEIGFSKFRLINASELSLILIFLSFLVFSPIIRRINNWHIKTFVDFFLAVVAMILFMFIFLNIKDSMISSDNLNFPFKLRLISVESYIIIENVFVLIGIGISFGGYISYFYSYYINKIRNKDYQDEPIYSGTNLDNIFMSLFIIIITILSVIVFMEGRTSNLFKDIRSILEVLYFISSILLVYGVLVGLRQLRATEKQFIHNTNDKTLEIMKWIATEYLTELQKFIEIDEIKDRKFNGKMNDKFRMDHLESLKEIVDIKVKHKGNILVNQLEFISNSVLLKLANEEVIFKSFGRDYCAAVEWLYELICVSRRKGDEEFSSTIELYTRWKSRIAART